MLPFVEAKDRELRDLGNRRRDIGIMCIRPDFFLPQDILSIILQSLMRFSKRKLAFLYPEPPAAGAAHPRVSRITSVLRRWIRLIPAGVIWLVGRFFEWVLKREVSFPVGTLTYFIWNGIDIVLLKKANEVLVGGGKEKSFAAFGQIVPIVMVFAVAFPICDVLQGALIEPSKRTRH